MTIEELDKFLELNAQLRKFMDQSIHELSKAQDMVMKIAQDLCLNKNNSIQP